MLKISTKLSTFSYSHWKWKVNHCSVAYIFPSFGYVKQPENVQNCVKYAYYA